MLVNKPSLNPLARAALLEIQRAGVSVTPDIVLWVHEAATKIRKTPLRPVAELVDWPTMCGGVALYPLSFGAVAWLMGLPQSMRRDVSTIGYACAHSHHLAVLARNRTAIKAAVAVASWAFRLRCSHAALSAAVDEVIGTDHFVEIKDRRKLAKSDDSWEWGAVIRALCTRYPGTTPSYWTWDVSREYALSMAQSANEDLPDDVKVTPHEIEANAAFRSIVEHIKEHAHG